MDALGPLTLRPGDRRIRAVLHDGPPADDPWWVERSCGRCTRVCTAGSGAVVAYGPHDTIRPDTAALCQGCAAALTPFRFAIDLERSRSPDESDPVCREVAAHVDRVVTSRAEPSGDAVWIRAADVHDLARELGTTRTHLALRLRDLGLLTGVEVATELQPGTARRSRERPAALA